MARPRPDRRGGSERLYGLHPVAEALRARRRRLQRLVLRRGRDSQGLRRIRARAEALGLSIELEDEPGFSKLLPEDVNHQGVILEAGPLETVTLEELVGREWAVAERAPLLVALDEVKDPQNVGAIARVADAAGASGLVLTQRHSPPLSPAVARASAGAIESLPVARVPNLAAGLERLQERGFWIFGADLEASEDLFGLPDRVFSGPACVVLGAEGRGLRPGVRRRLDHRIHIPMGGRVASLNVAAAAAVVLFEWVRRGRA